MLAVLLGIGHSLGERPITMPGSLNYDREILMTTWVSSKDRLTLIGDTHP